MVDSQPGKLVSVLNENSVTVVTQLPVSSEYAASALDKVLH